MDQQHWNRSMRQVKNGNVLVVLVDVTNHQLPGRLLYKVMFRKLSEVISTSSYSLSNQMCCPLVKMILIMRTTIKTYLTWLCCSALWGWGAWLWVWCWCELIFYFFIVNCNRKLVLAIGHINGVVLGIPKQRIVGYS